jgi:hypothetical protein
MRMSVIGNNTLLVWASPNDHEQVEAILQSIPVPAIEVLPLYTLQPSRTVETLRAMFKSAAGMYLEADTARDVVMVRGNPEQIKGRSRRCWCRANRQQHARDNIYGRTRNAQVWQRNTAADQMKSNQSKSSPDKRNLLPSESQNRQDPGARRLRCRTN